MPLGLAAAIAGIGIIVLGSMRGWSASDSVSPEAASAAISAAAAPASQAVEPAVLTVETQPAGAEVAIDGRPGGTTPGPITLNGPGPFTLRLSKRGFVPREVKLTEADLARGSLSYALEAIEVPKVAVSIASAYPVEVLSGSQTLADAATSHQLSVPAGSRLRVVARDLLLDTVINVSGKPVRYSPPPVGRLTILTKFETCSVKIGDRVLGFPPITRMPVVAGQYRVDIVCPVGTNPPGQFVTVPANEAATVRIY